MWRVRRFLVRLFHVVRLQNVDPVVALRQE